jgi:hypothetical protein
MLTIAILSACSPITTPTEDPGKDVGSDDSQADGHTEPIDEDGGLCPTWTGIVEGAVWTYQSTDEAYAYSGVRTYDTATVVELDDDGNWEIEDDETMDDSTSMQDYAGTMVTYGHCDADGSWWDLRYAEGTWTQDGEEVSAWNQTDFGELPLLVVPTDLSDGDTWSVDVDMHLTDSNGGDASQEGTYNFTATDIGTVDVPAGSYHTIAIDWGGAYTSFEGEGVGDIGDDVAWELTSYTR